jgi:hypothetical protein
MNIIKDSEAYNFIIESHFRPLLNKLKIKPQSFKTTKDKVPIRKCYTSESLIMKVLR